MSPVQRSNGHLPMGRHTVSLDDIAPLPADYDVDDPDALVPVVDDRGRLLAYGAAVQAAAMAGVESLVVDVMTPEAYAIDELRHRVITNPLRDLYIAARLVDRAVERRLNRPGSTITTLGSWLATARRILTRVDEGACDRDAPDVADALYLRALARACCLPDYHGRRRSYFASRGRSRGHGDDQDSLLPGEARLRALHAIARLDTEDSRLIERVAGATGRGRDEAEIPPSATVAHLRRLARVGLGPAERARAERRDGTPRGEPETGHDATVAIPPVADGGPGDTDPRIAHIGRLLDDLGRMERLLATPQGDDPAATSDVRVAAAIRQLLQSSPARALRTLVAAGAAPRTLPVPGDSAPEAATTPTPPMGTRR